METSYCSHALRGFKQLTQDSPGFDCEPFSSPCNQHLNDGRQQPTPKMKLTFHALTLNQEVTISLFLSPLPRDRHNVSKRLLLSDEYHQHQTDESVPGKGSPNIVNGLEHCYASVSERLHTSANYLQGQILRSQCRKLPAVALCTFFMKHSDIYISDNSWTHQEDVRIIAIGQEI